MKSTAPALSGGLALLRALESGPASLEVLAGSCGLAKATALRLLRTLAGEGLAEQGADRRWRGLARIETGTADTQARRKACLEDLARRSRRIVEVYRVDGETAVLEDRCEPPDCAVTLRAGIGYVRDRSEVEAVAQCLRAFGGPSRSKAKAWVWRDRREAPLTARQLKDLVAACLAEGIGRDVEANSFGVRRCAVPIRNGGRLVAILALAAPGGWRADEEQALAALLRRTATLLESLP